MKSIIIIGASSGIGRQVALIFVRMGWRVGVAARSLDKLLELQSTCPERIFCKDIDVTAPDAVERFEALVEQTGGMDAMLYCAGCGWSNPELDPALDRRTIDVNVSGFTAIVTAAYRYFRRRQIPGGRIAAIISVAGTKGLGVSAAYSATKRYQWTYLQALRQLASIQKVSVSITDIRPGFVDTDLLGHDRSSYPMLMSTAYVAPRIVRAILRRRSVAVIDSRWAVLTALWRMIPDVLWRRLPVDFPNVK